MYDDGVMDLPFSFILAQRGDRNVLVDTGFMQDDGSSGFSRKFGIPYWISPVRHAGRARRRSRSDDHRHRSSRTRISTIWVRSPSSRTRISTSRRASCCPGTRPSRCRKRFGHLTAIIDPDNLRTALEASIEHRVTLVDGDKDNVLPGIHVRLGSGHTIGQQFVIVETARGPARDLGRLRLLAAPVHRAQR